MLGSAALMIAAHLGFRAWALYPAWFFADDFRLMLDAAGSDPDPEHLLAPHDNHLMPLARLVVWLVTEAGPMNWTLAASLTMFGQLLASLACLWMLITLFGRRWIVLIPLSIYLTSAVAAPAFIWWAAAINQLPLQIAFFWAVTVWVQYLRTRALRYLALTLLALLLALGFYEKALVIGVVLAFVAVAYFAQGSLRVRLVHVARRYWPAVVSGSVLVVAYLSYYGAHVPRPFEENETGGFVADDIADSMLGTALPTGLLGGPWRWFDTSPPIVLAGPPTWTVHAAWVALVLLVLYGAMRRSRTLRAWALLAIVALVSYLILVVSRGQLFGGLSGLEYRYLTDVVCAAVLAFGLAFAELDGAEEASAPRPAPVLGWALPTRAVVVGTVLMSAGGLVSWFQYAQFWHHDNVAEGYVETLRQDLADQGPVDLADQVLPSRVFPAYAAPRNRTSVFVPLFSRQARFPEVSDDLRVVDEGGSVRPAVIGNGVQSLPGPAAGCGWPVTSGSVTIPLDGEAFDYTWWVRIGYLGSADDTMTVTTGDQTVRVPVLRGLHAVFLQVTADFSTVTLSGLGAGNTVCVDDVSVGDVTPGGPA